MLGLKYLSPSQIRENKELLVSFYNEEESSPIVREGRACQLVEEYVPSKDSIILECAPATGLLMKQLRDRGYKNLHGADIDNYLSDPKLCELKTLDFSFESLPWPNASFDAILSFETIEHMENPYFFIREMRRVLKPDGILVLSMPNVQHIFNKIFFLRKGDMPRWRKNNGHLWVAPKGVFQKAFMHSFSLVETKYYKGFFPYRFLGKLKGFPENEWFAHTAIFIFRPK